MWGGGLWMLVGPMIMLLFIAAAAIVIVAVVRSASGHPRHAPGPSGDGAKDILRERFARGEIDQQEFEERMRVLDKR